MPEATSVFFGGGTPSLLPASSLVALLSAVPRSPGCEVTVECNPDHATPSLLSAWAAAGVTRVSFGVQSTQAHVLQALDRSHDASSVAPAASLARSLFPSWSVDLIYGVAGESRDDWRRTVDDVLALEPPHVSAYALTVEPGTPLSKLPSRWPDDDDQAEKYVLADAAFGAAGLASYEISNWAEPGHECRHNQLYWSQGDYLGVGCAAHSHVDGRRWWNVRTPERFILLVRSGGGLIAGEETLVAAGREREALELSLRTRRGVPERAVAGAGVDHLLEPADERGWVRLTVAGRLLANEVAVRLAVGAEAG